MWKKWQTAIYKESWIPTLLRVICTYLQCKFQMDQNFNIENKIIKVLEENMSLGWKKALIFIELNVSIFSFMPSGVGD